MSTNESARAAEGMTADEQKYFETGGNVELTTPAGDAPAPVTSEPAAPDLPKVDAQDAPLAPSIDDDDDGGDPNAMIPRATLLRERKKLRDRLNERDQRLNEQTGQLSALQQQWARLDERFKLFQEAATPPPQEQQPEAPPDPETDPFGAIKYVLQRQRELDGQQQQVVQQTQEQRAYTELTNHFRADAAKYSQTNPDFMQAYRHLLTDRDAELQSLGFTDQAERLRIITADERDLVARAFAAREQNPNAPSPAQMLYNLALRRGYQKAAAANGAAGAAPAAPGGAPAGNGAAPSVTQQVEQIAKQQNVSRSLSSGGGAPVPQGLDLSRLAAMTDGEYLEFMRGLTPAQRREYHAMIGAPN